MGRALDLWDSREQGDLDLEVQTDTFRVHRCVLASASPVFRAMLSSPMLESRNSSVRVADADPADFLAMLRFVYLGELTDVTPPQQLPGVLQLAHRYNIKDL